MGGFSTAQQSPISWPAGCSAPACVVPRISRVVISGPAHHVTQRGNSRQGVDKYKGGGSCCRVLVGMHRAPVDYMKAAQGLVRGEERLGGTQRARMRDDAIADFRQQLEFGIPTLDAEKTLRKLVEQLRSHRLQLKQFMRYPLHAKLYIVHRDFHGSELLDYIGSSNLTLAGLTGQGELNIDVAA